MKLKHYIGFFLLLLAVSSIKLLAAEDEPEPIIIAAADNIYPFSFVLPDGTASGLYVEFWELWSRTNAIPIKIIATPYNESIKIAQNKNSILVGVFKTEERGLWADFSQPIHSVTTGILYSKSFPKTTRLANTIGLKIAVLKSSFQENYLKQHFPSLELFLYYDLEEAIIKLLNNEIHAIVAEIPAINAQLSRLRLKGVFSLADEKLLKNEVHGAIAKGQTELLGKINRGIDNIAIKDLVALEKRWLPTLTPFFKDMVNFEALTLAEKK